MPDSELSVLQEKVERLTRDRNIAQRQAARDNALLQEFKTQIEEYSKLLAGAEARVKILEEQLLEFRDKKKNFKSLAIFKKYLT